MLAYACALAVSLAGRKLGWLDRGGTVAAAAVGGTIFAFAGWRGAALLIAFFVTSSLLSRLPNSGAPGAARQSSPTGRNGRQVLANGGVAALIALGMGFATQPDAGASLLALAFAGSIASVTADTWASEIGRFYGQVPRSAITFRPLAPGESGGMTVAGTFGGMMGAAAIGWTAALLWPELDFKGAAVVEAAGTLGMWVDSLLGASLQFKGVCPTCGRLVEDPRHPHALASHRGFAWFDNDAVNLLAAAAGAGLAVYLGIYWG